jgi:hypothetical protein
MPREAIELPKPPTWRTILVLGGLVVVLSGLAFWLSQNLPDRQQMALKRVLASLAAEKTVLEQHWAAGTVPASLLTVESKHIDEESDTTSQELQQLKESAGDE